MDCAIYRDGCRVPEQLDWRQAIDEVDRTGAGFLWIGMHEPNEAQFAGIAERFGLHPLAVEDVIHARQRPKLEAYDDAFFAVVLHAVLDSIVDSYVVVCRALQEDIDEAETAVFSSPNRITDSNVIYVLKREVLELWRATAPLAPVLRRLSQAQLEQIEPRVRDYFRDVDDHLSEVVDRVNGFDDLLTTLVSANLARVSVVQNEDMRKISAWVAMAAVPTMLAGIYGMNFDHMPELHWRYGYPLVIAVMLTFCATLYRAFKRNGWL